MTRLAYELFVEKLFVSKSSGVDGFLHAAVGMAGEAGEILDLIKKMWANNRPLDVAMMTKLMEEMGDLVFYQQAMMARLATSIEELREHNITKLMKRYPDGYSHEASLARRDKGEAGVTGL